MDKNERKIEVPTSDLKEPPIKKVSRTGSWDWVMVYDTESGDVSRHRKCDVEKGKWKRLARTSN